MNRTQDFTRVLVNSPVPVNFAGMRGTTASLQASGWQLNVESDRSPWDRRINFRLMGKHPTLGLYFYSGVAQFDEACLMSQSHFIDASRHMEFPIRACAEAVNLMIPVAAPVVSVATVDFSKPFINETRQVHLEEICIFKAMNVEAEIYLPEKKIISVQEYLDEVLKEQMSKQQEIREKRKKKSYRDTQGEFGDVCKQQQEVKLQLVSI